LFYGLTGILRKGYIIDAYPLFLGEVTMLVNKKLELKIQADTIKEKKNLNFVLAYHKRDEKLAAWQWCITVNLYDWKVETGRFQTPIHNKILSKKKGKIEISLKNHKRIMKILLC
jgi:hypothetical protein